MVDRSDRTGSTAFARMVAHDLRSPATAVRMGIGELTRLLRDDEEKRKLGDLVEEYAYRAVAAADDAADLIALQAGAFEPSQGEVDLASLAESLRHDSRATRVEVAFERPARACVVRGDYPRIRRVLSGLVTEACLRARATVKLELRAEDELACLEILADGTSVSPEQVRSLLDARRRPPTFRVGHGLGLRLAIARDVLAAHGGNVEVAAAGGGRVCVTVRLPLL